MSRCLNCGKRMLSRRDFCSDGCGREYFRGVVGVDLKAMSTNELRDELLSRDDGLSSIDSNILADELVERNCNLEMFGFNTIMESIKNRTNVRHISCQHSYRDYGVYVEQGEVVHGTGNVDIFILEGMS